MRALLDDPEQNTASARRLSNDNKYPPVYHLPLQSRVLSPRDTCQTTHNRTRPRSTLSVLNFFAQETLFLKAQIGYFFSL